MDVSNLSVWTVEFSTPPNEKQNYRRNYTRTVLTTSAQRALELIGVEYPNALVHALHIRSRGEMIIDWWGADGTPVENG